MRMMRLIIISRHPRLIAKLLPATNGSKRSDKIWLIDFKSIIIMTRIIPQLCFLLLLLIGAHCNIWDNIYSQTYASSPIILEDSLSLDFKIPQYSLTGTFDYNSELALTTVTIFFDALLTQLEVFKAELDLKTITFSVVQAGKSGCQKYQL